MSQSAARESREVRRMCQGCQERRARFRYRGEVRADRDHTLCFECFRSERERQRASVLAARLLAHQVFLVPAAQARALAPSQVAHRWRMLGNLAAGTVGRSR